jgi:hypothetical protein
LNNLSLDRCDIFERIREEKNIFEEEKSIEEQIKNKVINLNKSKWLYHAFVNVIFLIFLI